MGLMGRKRESKAGKEARLRFYEQVLGKGGCWLKTITPHECDGPIDPCHLLPKQRLKNIAKQRGYTDDETLRLVWDERNGVPGCRAFHHKLDNGFMRVYWSQIPMDAYAFAHDWDLEWEMEQMFRKEQ
jgi:hypothetical protein